MKIVLTSTEIKQIVRISVSNLIGDDALGPCLFLRRYYDGSGDENLEDAGDFRVEVELKEGAE